MHTEILLRLEVVYKPTALGRCECGIVVVEAAPRTYCLDTTVDRGKERDVGIILIILVEHGSVFTGIIARRAEQRLEILPNDKFHKTVMTQHSIVGIVGHLHSRRGREKRAQRTVGNKRAQCKILTCIISVKKAGDDAEVAVQRRIYGGKHPSAMDILGSFLPLGKRNI